MFIVDYQSKSYQRFLNDLPQISNHKTRFLVTFNGGSEENLMEVAEQFAKYTENATHYSTAVNDKALVSDVNMLFSNARNNRDTLIFKGADLLFDKKTALKKSHERDIGFDLNNFFKSIAKHNGIVILATDKKQTLSASMSTKVDVLIRFPNV